MVLDKIQHYFSHIFLLILVVLQGVVFVASKASQSPDFQAVFLSPGANQSLIVGQAVNLKANLSEQDQDFSIVYFQVQNSEANIDLSFEAQKQADGFWTSLAAWDTQGIPAGYYSLSALAHIYDSAGYLTESFESIPQTVYLAYPIEMSQINEEEEQIPVPPDPEPEKEASPVLSASIISPSLATVSSTIDLIIEFNQELLDAQVVSAYLLLATSTVATLELQSLDNLQYSTALDTANYQNGDYNLIFYLDNDDVASQDLTISNPLVPTISLTSPAVTSQITVNSFVVNLTTNFAASDFSLEFINSTDPAISTGELGVAVTDGYAWTKTINLGSSFVDGAYTLMARAGEVETSFDFILDLVDETIGWPNSPAEIVLDLYALGPNLSGTVLAQASSSFSGLVVDFVAKDSVNQSETGRFESVYFGNMYGANIDTLTLPNGNYYLVAQTVFQDTTVESNSILVTVFNPSLTGESATTTPSTTPDQELEPEPEPETVQANNNLITIETGNVLFSRQTSCLQAGLADAKACLHFRGLLDGTLDARCIAQDILEPLACEDYLNLVYVEADCEAVNIFDREQCKDYLLEKSAGQVDCQLSDQNMCHDILRNTYLNRLTLGIKKQQAIGEALQSAVGQNMPIESLAGLLPDADLAISSGEILLVKSRQEIVLGIDNSLSVLNSVVMILDTDRDGLPDDLERYYGTDPQNADSDADGYADGVEIKNNYNPLGEGALNKARTALDQAVFAGESIRQPKLSADNIDNTLQVQSVSNDGDKIKLAGKAPANIWINIFIYSDVALLVQAQTDQSGDWSYTVPQNLSDGHHRVYLAVNDAEGKVVKQSSPVSFLVKSAQAVTAEEFFGAGTQSQIETNSWLIYYVIGGGILLVILTIVISYLFVHRSKDSFNPL